MKIAKWTIILVLCVCTHSIYAQRHYSGVSALEINYGTNIFGSSGNNLNISYSKYKNRTTYWKVGINYFDKSFIYDYEDLSLDAPILTSINKKSRNYYLDVLYAKTVATNLSSIYFNMGLGAFTGVEVYKKYDSEHNFLLGLKLEAELEYFLSGRVALLGRVKQYWSPFADISKWNTVWNVGVKILLY